MNADKLRSYCFSTEAHWDACLIIQADRDPTRRTSELRPFAPYTRPAILYPSPGAFAPAVTPAGEVLWRDDGGSLYRLCGDDDTPLVCRAPFGMSRAARVVTAASGLWVAGDPPESLQRYEEDTLTRLLTADIPEARVVDVAAGGGDSVLALVERSGTWQSVRLDRAGHVVDAVELSGISSARACVFLRRSRKIVVLAHRPEPRLYWFAAEGGRAVFSIAIAAMRPCFSANVLGSDSRDRVFVAGADGATDGGGAHVLVFDADGNSLGDVPLDPGAGPATGIAATRDSLLVTGPRGLLRFGAAQVVPEGTAQVACTLITPMLQSPDREDGRRWLRVEASADMPEGTTLEISVAATDDPAIRDRLKALAADESLPATVRMHRLLSEPDLWRERTEFHGSGVHGEHASAPFSAKLFDVKERYLWVLVTLSAAAGARLPVLSRLAVLYPGRTLMESLPAIYQRAEAEPHAFVRDLVGVLEATTQGLDASIASMGAHIHPTTAPEPWLDFIARWLGVPWDDGLDHAQKQAIVKRAAELAKGRGSRAGLEALLDSLMPGTPRRFRVTDATADFGFAIVGDDACVGSALPAMLGGLTRFRPELDSRSAVLGYMRLPCAGQREDGAWQLSGKVRVDVAASPAERKKWEPWLLALITEVVPLTARVELRWVSAHALRHDRLDGTLTLEAAPTPHLGNDAITGLARLPERGNRLSATGPDIRSRLR